ncbi:MAG TPA: hypothetical protein VKR52_09345 [Terracidiphilus sp.]|nr:hypothetical protein [Terracidiphilus sp.]
MATLQIEPVLWIGDAEIDSAYTRPVSIGSFRGFCLEQLPEGQFEKSFATAVPDQIEANSSNMSSWYAAA